MSLELGGIKIIDLAKRKWGRSVPRSWLILAQM